MKFLMGNTFKMHYLGMHTMVLKLQNKSKRAIQTLENSGRCDWETKERGMVFKRRA